MQTQVTKSARSKEELALDAVRSGRISIDDEGRVWKHWRMVSGGKKVIYSSPRRADHPDKIGYCRVGVHINGGTIILYAHRLVWVAANGPIPKGREINHKDGDKTNNRLSNLELTTHHENLRHCVEVIGFDFAASARRTVGARCKLGPEQVREMRRQRREEQLTPSYKTLGERFGLTGGGARAICIGKTRGGVN